MSVFPLDPPGIDAAGNSKLSFVPAIANPAVGPTVAELTAGTDISCALYTFMPSTTQNTVSRAKYCHRQASQSLGRAATTIEPIEYDYDPQKPDAAEYAYYAALVPGTVGYIVDRRGLDAKTVAFAADQYVDIYPVQLGERSRVAVDSTAEGDKLRTRQAVAVIGEVLYDRKIQA